MRALLGTLESPRHPQTTHAAFLAAYGFSTKADLLAPDREAAAHLERAEPVNAPGFPEPASPVTDDCIRPVQDTD